MGKIYSRDDAAKYFGLNGAKNVSERALVLPSFYDVELFSEMFNISEAGRQPYFGGMGLCNGKYKQHPISILVSGVGTWQAAWAMSRAKSLSFKKAVFFGSAGAVDGSLDIGNFVVPTISWGSLYKEFEVGEKLAHSPFVLAEEHITGPLGDEIANKSSDYRQGFAYSTDMDYGQEKLVLAHLRALKILAVDREHKNVLRGAALNGTEAAALLFITDRIGIDSPDEIDYEAITRGCMEHGLPSAMDVLISD